MEAPLEATALAPVLALAVGLTRPRGVRLAALAAAIGLLVVVFVTPLERLALHDFLWAHLLQNVVLAEWAPGLLALAVPAAAACRLGRLAPPLVALPLWVGTYYVWHLPALYDLALRHPHSLLKLEHLSYFAVGFLLWWPVVHGAYSAGAKALYLFAAFVLASPLGLLLALVPRPLYDFYLPAAPTWGISALGDQQLAGVTMAAEQALVFFVLFTVYLLRFLRDEQAYGLTAASPSPARSARARPAPSDAAPGSAPPRR